MELFNYGLGIVEEKNFIKPNKVNGGLWLCPKTELYSDWVVLTFYIPKLVKDPWLIGNTIILKDNVKMAHIDKDNHKEFMKNNCLDFDICKEYDILHFDENLIEIKEFEAYYFECYQILNFECIKNIIIEKLDTNKIISTEYLLKSKIIFNKIIKHLETTEVFKILKDLKGGTN